MAKLFEDRSDTDREQERQRELNSHKSTPFYSHLSSSRASTTPTSAAATSNSKTLACFNTQSNPDSNVITLPVSRIRILYVLSSLL